MLRLSKMTDYGAVVMTALAQAPVRVHNAAELASVTHVAEPAVGKLLKLLAKNGLVTSVRGAHGGYRLARPAEAIRMTEIITALEGPIGLTECAQHQGDCGIEHHCGVRGHWKVINRAIRHALDGVTLAELAAPVREVQRHVQPLMRMQAGV